MTLSVSGQYGEGNMTYTLVDNDTEERNDDSQPNESTSEHPGSVTEVPTHVASTAFYPTTITTSSTFKTDAPTSHIDSCKVLLQDIELANGVVIYGNCTIEIRNVTFQNATIQAPPESCGHVTINMERTDFRGKPKCEGVQCKDQKISNITCENVQIHIDKCGFYQTSFSVQGKHVTNMRISNSIFSNDPDEIQYLGGLHLTFSAYSADIYITNSTFEKQTHPSRVQSVINLYQASLWLKAIKEPTDRSLDTFAHVNITDCVFQDNERGITMVGPFAQISLERTLFLRNTAMHAGAAILSLINGANPLLILNCTFRDNVAGKFRDNYPIKETLEEFSIVGSEVSFVKV